MILQDNVVHSACIQWELNLAVYLLLFFSYGVLSVPDFDENGTKIVLVYYFLIN